MPKFLFQGRYTPEGVKGLLHDGGSGRREAVDKLVSSVGGRVESMYFAFGGTDVYVIADLPDNASAAAVALAVAQTGKASADTVVLMTPQEIDAAAKKSVTFRPPGG
jgi:uncharacterized protein with GYD domain